MQTHSLFANPSDQPGPSHTLRTTIATNAEEMHALPTSRAVNVYEETKALSGVTQFDISHTFELSNIHCVYAVLPPKTEIHCNVQPNVHHFVFIVHGTGGIYTESDGKALAQWDCFAFPPKKRSRAYTLVGGREGVGFVICSDKVVKGGAKLVCILSFFSRNIAYIPQKRDPPPVPTVVSSYDSTEWSGKGIFTAKKATLTALTDLSCVPDEDRPWNAAIECLLPGTQTSHPRAHLEEEEFVFVLAGKGRYWHDGEEPGQTLIAGDCVGWKAGTGVAHSIINDADGPNGEGKSLTSPFFG